MTDQYAASGYYADIQAALNKSVAGDKAHIPVGAYNFHDVGDAWTPVTIPAGVSLFGAPTIRDASGQVTQFGTILNMPFNAPTGSQWFKMGTGLQELNKPSRFSDIYLKGYRSTNPASVTLHSGVNIYGVINYRVDHCLFEHTAGGGVAVPLWYQQNMKCCGVIDHNKLINPIGWDNLVNYTESSIGYGVSVGQAYNPDPAFAQPMPFEPAMSLLGKYTDHTHFLEDNIFTNWRHCVASGHGGYYVFRHNTVIGDEAHFSMDVHGLRDAEYGRAGGRGFEVYENTFIQSVPRNSDGMIGIGASFGGLFQTGGGCGAWFNNYVDSTYNQAVIYVEDAVDSPIWHVDDLYVWGGKGNTIFMGFPKGAIPAGRNILVDWARQAGSEGDVGYPNVNPLWSIYGYKPYIYPHPLVSEAPPDSVTPKSQLIPQGTYRLTVPNRIQG